MNKHILYVCASPTSLWLDCVIQEIFKLLETKETVVRMLILFSSQEFEDGLMSDKREKNLILWFEAYVEGF